MPRALALSAMLVALLVATASLAGCGDARPKADASPTIITASQQQPLVYVALGDSYTGAPKLGTTLTRACRRTDQNYPHLVAADMGLTLVDVSCGGAKVRDLSHRQKAGVPAQVDAVRSDADLVTVSVGGNDVGIVKVVSSCVAAPAACDGAVAAVHGGVRQMRGRLTRVLRRIGRVAPHARLVVIGYPEILPANGRCLGADRARVKKAAKALRLIATAQRQAAWNAGATFLDARSFTRGHGLCTTAPWIARRTTATSKRYHPEAPEQRAIATALDGIVSTLR
ncbi:SGNH/GDSL hydrolase family protein [Nocardioides sp. Kera G14]|uniref:SGNH/GDSL hydrolase family protein n=1 Tax=Nocardioides sp. Kera G14 TaxID=2884264 RepID=UPI001D125F14|nr:SGNH/GDSL hydrolase family protein [Nocardioides sp. Kera G14]UDY23264.1 SGNH/GDSL hydrolase family protein [Nocardioides sp. Kera G14]